MCPLCDESYGCKQWDLSDVCTYAKISYLFDHPGTVGFAIFVSFWCKCYSLLSIIFGLEFDLNRVVLIKRNIFVLLNLAVTFLEYWKRYSARLAHRWDVEDVEREEIRPRPEFALKVC